MLNSKLLKEMGYLKKAIPWVRGLMKRSIKLTDRLAGKEHEKFLSDNQFELALVEDGDDFSYTVVKNSNFLLAFTYQRNQGENLMVAEIETPVSVEFIAARKRGWSLIGEVWKDAYKEYHAARKKASYPNRLTREQEVVLIDKVLREFTLMVKNKDVIIGNPAYRMEKYKGT